MSAHLPQKIPQERRFSASERCHRCHRPSRTMLYVRNRPFCSQCCDSSVIASLLEVPQVQTMHRFLSKLRQILRHADADHTKSPKQKGDAHV